MLRPGEQVPGVVNSDNNLSKVSTDIWFNINRDKAGLFGVPVHIIDMTIRTAIAGTKAGSYRDKQGKDYDIVMRLPAGSKMTVEDLDRIYVPSLKGKMIPLSQLARIEFRDAPGIISHYNLRRDATITADIEKGYQLDDVVAVLRPYLDSYSWPPRIPVQVYR